MELSPFDKEIIRKQSRKAWISDAVKGFLLTAIGAALTKVSEVLLAPSWEGRYFIFWGAMVWGGILLIRSVIYFVFPDIAYKDMLEDIQKYDV